MYHNLQAQLPVPIGNSSAFYYKSKLNCYNLTVTDTKKDSTTCFFWHERLGSKGSTEIGTCVYKFLEQVAENYPDADVIFYSDNCCGQQKNCMYHYAVENLAIHSVCHKFLINGHSQNEGDSAHSLIEKSIKRAKKSGPIYVPDQYINLEMKLRELELELKKGNPFVLHEMHYNDFYDLKALADQQGIHFNKDCSGNVIKVTDITMIKFTKNSDCYKYEISYEGEWIDVKAKIVRGRKRIQPLNPVHLKPAYYSKMNISEQKKNDILQLVRSNIVPSYYESFYNNL